jgi:hypothetical protein
MTNKTFGRAPSGEEESGMNDMGDGTVRDKIGVGRSRSFAEIEEPNIAKTVIPWTSG